MKLTEHRHATRKDAKLLAEFVASENTYPAISGYGRVLNLSSEGALLEVPDALEPGQLYNLTLFLDYDRRATVEGRVKHVSRVEQLYHVGFVFRNLSLETQYLLDLQNLA